ncbi:MAG: hypothetical protein CV082_07840 [Candidatus Brocadia sp. BL1]|nr:MAG: hypothetical protein CV082_07840 [Candidatus Brocadia sp. BL1]
MSKGDCMRILRMSILCLVFNLVIYFLFSSTLLAWPEGPPAYRTGAVGDIGTCNADLCHNSFSLNSGSAKFSIVAPSVYSAGKSATVEVSFSDSQGVLYGFEMTAVDAVGKRVGSFKKIGKTMQVIPPKDYRGLKKKDKGKYIEHSYKGIKKKQWKFKWVAPGNAIDPITFYAAGVEAIAEGNIVKDYVYTTTAEIVREASKQ